MCSAKIILAVNSIDTESPHNCSVIASEWKPLARTSRPMPGQGAFARQPFLQRLGIERAFPHLRQCQPDLPDPRLRGLGFERIGITLLLDRVLVRAAFKYSARLACVAAFRMIRIKCGTPYFEQSSKPVSKLGAGI